MTAKERQQLEDVLQRIDKVNNELMALDDGPVDMDSLMQALEALSIKINDILEMDENKTARDFETEISLLGSMSKEELTEMIKGGSR